MNVSFEVLQQELARVLIKNGFSAERAAICSRIFAENSRDGVYSHGLSRFPTFIRQLKGGEIDPQAEPVCLLQQGVIEYWDGHRAPGMYAATIAMRRAIAIAQQQGMGAVSLRESNHWMRGGTYGLLAAEAGCIGICATNAIGSMPPWGSVQPRLGNNPLVFAFPRAGGPVVLDLAMSQYSYGKMNEYRMKGEQLPFDAGYDSEGRLTKDPSAIIDNKRPLPIGLWKGSALAMVLDILTAALSIGNPVSAISKTGKEGGVSQFFLAIDARHMDAAVLEEIITYTKGDEGDRVFYPGEQMMATRLQNMEQGIPVNPEIWQTVCGL
ncbi:3-dehydro-L-gulonate 2-dehydrogenase [Taibaiella chishuiensis]|uniref:3-dehydro-L-gulonate 2-dehydrogenase n=1 Tax=Taibaiella chishuiensis TaxID=1434707 RepID=A0A2P8DA53_9BACT|nr:3-dehydro-L-gulonate 2-dehydrogenase [Taibaiella chishuiensis]PSK94108.1 3-dehydro-L-gulonate 2-dehydrogenase [Taibaiella chishuiensis]